MDHAMIARVTITSALSVVLLAGCAGRHAPPALLVTTPRVLTAQPSARGDAFAAEVAARLDALGEDVAQRTGAGSPSRSPRPSCVGVECEHFRIGALVLEREGGCVAVLLAGDPRRGPVTLHPWVGTVRVPEAPVPFDAPPEASLTVQDYAPCVDAVTGLDAVLEALAGRVAIAFARGAPPATSPRRVARPLPDAP